jgi:hypothetical protein
MFALNSVGNVYLVVTVIYCWPGRGGGGGCITKCVSGEGRGRRGAGGGDLTRALLIAFCHWEIILWCGIFYRGGGRGGGVLNIFKVAFRIIVYCY